MSRPDITNDHPAGAPKTSVPAPAHVVESATAEPWINRGATETARRAAQARQVSGRRRNVDPATTERDYSTAEVEFMNAMQEYKRSSGRNFPTWSEVLEVLRALGYEKSAEESAEVEAESRAIVA